MRFGFLRLRQKTFPKYAIWPTFVLCSPVLEDEWVRVGIWWLNREWYWWVGSKIAISDHSVDKTSSGCDN